MLKIEKGSFTRDFSRTPHPPHGPMSIQGDSSTSNLANDSKSEKDILALSGEDLFEQYSKNMRKKKYGNARFYIEKSLELVPNNIDLVLKHLEVLSNLLQADQLLNEYEKKLVRLPQLKNDSNYHMGLGKAYLKNQEFTKALEQFQQAIKSDQSKTLIKSPDFYICRAKAYYHLQEPRHSYRDMKKAIKLNPNIIKEPNFLKIYNKYKNAYFPKPINSNSRLNLIEEGIISSRKLPQMTNMINRQIKTENEAKTVSNTEFTQELPAKKNKKSKWSCFGCGTPS
ncbi:MAG: hypothetical protein JWM09_696 [Francisellaceae bacterium]|nr:hypothetical protein [Francisellaceae bacterium]